MEPLFYLLKVSAIKRIKTIFKNPVTAIGISILLLILVVPTIINAFWGQKTPLNKYYDLIITCIYIVFGLINFFTVFNNDKTSFFTLGEYNLVFPAPIKPKKILVYVLIKNFLVSVILYTLLLMVLPRYIGSISLSQYLILVLSFSVLILSFAFYYLWAFLLGDKAIKYFKIGVYIFTLILILGCVYYYLNAPDNKDILKTFKNFAGSNFMNYFPIFGWAKSSIVFAIKGEFLNSVIFNLLNLLPISITIIGILKTDRDYYEDTLKRAKAYQTIQEAVKKGNYEKGIINNKKVKKQVKMEMKTGAWALFSKKLLEFRKSGFNFSKMSLILPLSYITIFPLIMKSTHAVEKVGGSFFMALLILLIAPMSVSYDVKEFLTDELKKQYVYLIPDSSFKKGFCLTLIPFFVAALKGILYLIVLELILKANLLSMVMIFVLYLSVSLLNIYAALFTARIAGASNNILFTFFVKIVISIITIVPSIILFGLVFSALKDSGFYLTIILISLFNLLIAGLLLFFSRKMFEVAELNN